MKWRGGKRGESQNESQPAAELLAAHAAGGLEPAEVARVEAHLASHPEARAELDEITRLLADVRAAEPRPHGDEPDWDAMAREIRLACNDDAQAPSRWWMRPWRPWRPWRTARTAALAASGAAAIALALIAVSRGQDPAAPAGDESVATVDGHAAPDPAAEPAGSSEKESAISSDKESGADLEGSDGDAGENPELRTPVLAALSGEELDRLERSLEEDAPEDAFVADLLRADSLEPGSAAAGVLDSGDTALAERGVQPESPDADEPAIDAFEPPDYVPIDELADELPDEAIEAIDRFLAEAQAG